jgi:hypothetical protein
MSRPAVGERPSRWMAASVRALGDGSPRLERGPVRVEDEPSAFRGAPAASRETPSAFQRGPVRLEE